MYRKYAVLAAALVMFGCGDDDQGSELGPTWFDEPMAELPDRFSEFGTFESSEIERSDVVFAYEPAYPLWSAGAEKSRAVVVPDGESITNADGTWDVPVGSVFFKTFYWEDAPVETRVMRKLDADWEFSAYLWDEDGIDAQRLEMRRSTPVQVSYEGESFEHRVPNEIDCRKCHEPTDGMVLGFSELQLGEQVDELHADGVLEFPLGDDPRVLPTASPLETQVLAGFMGNCANCHNGSEHDQASFDLAPEVAFENLIEQPTASSAAAAGIRVVPGASSESMLYLAISGTGDDPEIKEMPPVGLELRDEAFVESVRTWIDGLPPEN